MASDKVIIGSVVGVAGCFLLGCFAFILVLVYFFNCMIKTSRNVDDEEQQAGGGITSNRVNRNYQLNNQVLPNQQIDPKSQKPASYQMLEMLVHKILSDKPVEFSPEELYLITQNYSKPIGKGGFGLVYKGKLPNGEYVAVKILKMNINRVANEQFLAEVSTIGRTFHINLVKLKGFCFEEKALVYEYVENGSLENYLFGVSRRIDYEKLYEIAVGTAKGLAYLHDECEKVIVHYDIKPSNILLTTNFDPKVADFGIASMYDRDASHFTLTGPRGTVGYAAPEMWDPLCKILNSKCDVYSFGMVLFEIFGGRRNLDGRMPQEQMWYPKWVWTKVEGGQIDDLLSDACIEELHWEKARTMIKIALWCIQRMPTERPSMPKVVRMLEGVEEVPEPSYPNFLVSMEEPSLYHTMG